MASESLPKSIEEAIKENLPDAHAGVLKDYIQQAEIDKKELERYKNKCKEQETELSRLKKFRDKADELDKREKKVSSREHDAKHKDEILSLREAHAKERVEEIRGLTQSVFGSNRMNYNLDVTVPQYRPVDRDGNPSYNAQLDHNLVSGTVTKED